MLDKSKAVHSLFKLIDACTQCRQIFHAFAPALTNPVHKNLVETIGQKLGQFGIELRNEIRRLGEADLDQLRFESLQGNSCDRALRRMLDYYEQAFNCPVSPHTRAMLTRQYTDLLQIYRDINWLDGAA